MSLERGDRILLRHARAVVTHLDHALATVFQNDLDRARTGVDRVLHELLHDGRRTLDDFSRRDLVDQVVGKDFDACRVRNGRGHWLVRG